MSCRFDLLGSMDVEPETVREYKEQRGIGLMEAKKIAKANALYSELTDMRYSLGRFEGMSTGEKLDELLEMMMAAVITD